MEDKNRTSANRAAADKCDWVVLDSKLQAARPSADKCDWVVQSKGAAGLTRKSDQPGPDKCDWIASSQQATQGARVAADKCDWVIDRTSHRARVPETRG